MEGAGLFGARHATVWNVNTAPASIRTAHTPPPGAAVKAAAPEGGFTVALQASLAASKAPHAGGAAVLPAKSEGRSERKVASSDRSPAVQTYSGLTFPSAVPLPPPSQAVALPDPVSSAEVAQGPVAEAANRTPADRFASPQALPASPNPPGLLAAHALSPVAVQATDPSAGQDAPMAKEAGSSPLSFGDSTRAFEPSVIGSEAIAQPVSTATPPSDASAGAILDPKTGAAETASAQSGDARNAAAQLAAIQGVPSQPTMKTAPAAPTQHSSKTTAAPAATSVLQPASAPGYFSQASTTQAEAQGQTAAALSEGKATAVSHPALIRLSSDAAASQVVQPAVPEASLLSAAQAPALQDAPQTSSAAFSRGSSDGGSEAGKSVVPSEGARQGTQGSSATAQLFSLDPSPVTAGNAAPAPVPLPHTLAPAQPAHAGLPTLPGDSGATDLGSPIHTARLLQSAGGSEMRVGLHSAEFGSISIATSVSSGALQASIALDHGGLGHAIAAHLPAMEEKFGIAARIEVRDAAQTGEHPPRQGEGSASSSQGGGRGSRAWTPSAAAPAGPSERNLSTAAMPALSTARLSVLA